MRGLSIGQIPLQILSYLLCQLQYAWLAVEVLVQSALPISPQLSCLLINIPTYAFIHHMVVIALNRMHAVFFTLSYDRLWTRRFTQRMTVGCWLCSALLNLILT